MGMFGLGFSACFSLFLLVYKVSVTSEKEALMRDREARKALQNAYRKGFKEGTPVTVYEMNWK